MTSNAFLAYAEGWALYAESPLIAKDTDTYNGQLLYKYGMLKLQVIVSLFNIVLISPECLTNLHNIVILLSTLLFTAERNKSFLAFLDFQRFPSLVDKHHSAGCMLMLNLSVTLFEIGRRFS